MSSSLPLVLVLQGPNLNLLGRREPGTYGRTSLAALQASLDELAAERGVVLRHVQSNHEGDLVDAVQQASSDGAVGCIVNAGAYTHTSIALRDAFSGTELPFIEVHISNVHAREGFRHHSYLSAISKGQVIGLGVRGYGLALEGLLDHLNH